MAQDNTIYEDIQATVEQPRFYDIHATVEIPVVAGVDLDHSKMNNLGFDECGHIGFQREINSSHKINADFVESGDTNKVVTQQEKEAWNGKQDSISDLNEIRQGAAAGSTALQSESDPTVPEWAKQPTKPTYTKEEVGLGNVGNFKAVSTVSNQGLTSQEQANARENIGAGTSNFNGEYGSLSGKPTKLSDFNNDVGFIVNTVANLVNYYTKQESYSKTEVNSLIGAIEQFHYEIYANTSSIVTPASNVLYLIGPTGSGADKYEEYVYANNVLTKIGDTTIDLSNYYNKTESDNRFVQKETGKQLSVENFTTALKEKLEGIEAGAQVNNFNETATYPDLTAGRAIEVLSRTGDEVSDETTGFLFRSTAGSTSIASNSDAYISSLKGNTYRGTNGVLRHFSADRFIAVGFQAFDKDDETHRLVGYKIDSSGNVVADADSTLVWIYALQGVAGDNNGYRITGTTTTPKVAWSATEPQEGSALTVLSETTALSEKYLPPSIGWLCISAPTAEISGMLVHLCWSYSDWSQFDTEYNRSQFAIEHQNEWGCPKIVGCADEFLKDTLSGAVTYIRRIARIDLSQLQWTVDSYQADDGQGGTMTIETGYKTTGLASLIKASTPNIDSDTLKKTVEEVETAISLTWSVAADGTVSANCDTAVVSASDIAQAGKYLYYELASAVIIETSMTMEYSASDMGTEQFTGSTIAPSAVSICYSPNLIDTLRNLAGSGVTFSAKGVSTSGVYYGTRATASWNGAASLDIENGVANTIVATLQGDTTLDLPDGGDKPFRLQIELRQDSTGGRALAFTHNGVANKVYNYNDTDFGLGTANQRCILSLLWNGENWGFTATAFIDEL